jgi:hypothetical protein
MKMAELKTKKNEQSVDEFIERVPDETKRQDCRTLVTMMQEITQEPPAMWGDSIVGFGSYHYKYASGHEGDMCIAGFSPRKQALTVYILPGFERYGDLMSKLGKHSTGKSCLYIKKLKDVDLDVLRELVRQSVETMRSGL